MKNYELGRKVLDRIDAQPETLNMTLWGMGMHTAGQEELCGTVACLAGHTLLAAGYSLKGGCFYRPDTDSAVIRVDGEASSLLGFDYAQSRVFFDYADGPERFRKMVEAAEKRAAGEGRLA